MNREFYDDLVLCETDVDGALSRLHDDEALYEALLKSFSRDTTVRDLECAIGAEAWDEAFTAAHALKGLAANLGFAPLFHTTGEMVVLIRAGRIDELNEAFYRIRCCHKEIMLVLRKHMNIDSKYLSYDSDDYVLEEGKRV